MKQDITDQAIALAGMFQATHLVKQLAWEGIADSYVQECSLQTIFKLDAPTVLDVYGGLTCINDGLTVLRGQMGGDRQSRDLELTRYTATLLHLERKLSRDRQMLDRLKESLVSAQAQLQQLPITHTNVISRLADLYQQTISTLSPRVIVNGDRAHLSNTDTASRIRALLLAGIRSAVLWRQCGGTRWKLILHRAGLLRAAEQMLCKSLH